MPSSPSVNRTTPELKREMSLSVGLAVLAHSGEGYWGFLPER